MATIYITADAAGGGAGTEGDPYTMAEGTANVSAGDKAWVEAGTYDVDDSSSSAVMDLDVAGTVGAWIDWEGYTTTVGDFDLGDAQPVILDANANTLTNAIIATTISGNVYNRFRGFRLTGASGDGFNGGTGNNQVTFEGCKFDTNGDRGLQANDFITLVACELTGNTTSAIDADSSTYLYGCKVHNEASTVILTQGGGIFYCLFYNNGNGINFRATGTMSAIGNSFDGDNQASSVAIEVAGSSTIPVLLYNNIFYDLGTGMNFGNAGVEEVRSRGFNLFFSNTNDYDTLSNHATDVTGTEDPFTNSGTRDYTLKSSSEAIDAGLDGGTV